MICAFGLITGSGKSRYRKLERRVISDIQLPIRYQVRCAASSQVSIGDGDQIGDLLPAGLVYPEPTEF